MSHFDELPRRSESQRTEGISRSAFHSAVTEYGLFEIKAENLDYGIDFELEAVDNRYQVTNARAAVQLKGTKCRLKENGSVAVRIKLRNLNYILMRRAGLFVCYHLPTKRLMAQTADAVAGSYGQSGKAWFKQESVTVTFKDAFDEAYQRRLRDWLLAFHRQERDRRVNRAGTPRAALGAVLESLDSSPIIPFELDPAKETLQGLYNSAQDSAISKSFDQFRAVLPHGELLTAYAAEINLGMAGHRCDRKRIRDGIEALSAGINLGILPRPEGLYNRANGWYALKMYEQAQVDYKAALKSSPSSPIAAQCHKNLGQTLERLGRSEAAKHHYERALRIAPNLAEAHWALALWHAQKREGELVCALEHLNAITWPKESAGSPELVHSLRAFVLLRLKRYEEAIRDLRSLLGVADHESWIWPRCASMINECGRSSALIAEFSVEFWNLYLSEFPDDIAAKEELLRCIRYLHNRGTGCAS